MEKKLPGFKRYYLQTEKSRYLLDRIKTYTLGRNSDCDIFLSDPTVSRSHARLMWDENTFVIHDERSTNGTFVNGKAVQQAALVSGDTIKLGKTVLKYSIASEDGDDEILSSEDSLLIEHRIQDLIGDVEDTGLKAKIGEIIGLFRAKKKSLSDLAYHDALTGLQNRRSFDRTMGDEWKRLGRYQRPLSLIMVDIDHFKKVNDTFGHQRGDAVLKTVAAIIKDNVRASDCVCRYGGEEIAVLLPEATLESALRTAEKLRELVEVQVHEIEGFPVTISLGVASYIPGMRNPEDLIQASDRALYRAKDEGRNRVNA